MIATINPATGQCIRTFEPLTESQIEEKLSRAAAAYQRYKHTTVTGRAGWLIRAAEILEAEKERLGRIITLEMGKPLRASIAEAAKCASGCRYYAEQGGRLLAEEPVDAGPGRSYIRYEPIGPVLAVMPWNFPFWQVFRFAAPALMAGNVGLLKHSSNVPQSALEIEAVIRRAGFPEDVFQTLLIGSSQAERVIGDSRVKAVTLTGSEPAGMQVASQAGKEIKKTVLELGGSDPFIVMPSADLNQALRAAIESRCINNGQSCISAKRFIVDAQIFNEFQQRFVAGMEALNVGDPMDESTDVGPLATPRILEGLEQQVRESIELGARLLTGGYRLNRPGNYFAPGVLTNIPPESPAYRDELFGPVASVFRVNGIDEAIHLANDTSFGLGASAWTKDAGEQQRFITEIEAGLVFINSMVASDPRLPFGGVKRSGYGRELSAYGIREFQNVKSVVVK